MEVVERSETLVVVKLAKMERRVLRVEVWDGDEEEDMVYWMMESGKVSIIQVPRFQKWKEEIR